MILPFQSPAPSILLYLLVVSGPPATFAHLQNRQEEGQNTCGYIDGNPGRPWTISSSYHCYSQPEYSVWGGCINLPFCDLLRACSDEFKCTSGECGGTAFVASCTGTASKCWSILSIPQSGTTWTNWRCGGFEREPVTIMPPISSIPVVVEVTTITKSSTIADLKYGNAEAPTRISDSTASKTGSLNMTAREGGSQTAAPTGVENSNDLSSAPPSSQSTDAPPNKSDNIPEIVGGVIGGVAVLSLLAFGIWCLRQRTKATNFGEPVPPWQSSVEVSDITVPEKGAESEVRPVEADTVGWGERGVGRHELPS